jgi:hypothetical protein
MPRLLCNNRPIDRHTREKSRSLWNPKAQSPKLRALLVFLFCAESRVQIIGLRSGCGTKNPTLIGAAALTYIKFTLRDAPAVTKFGMGDGAGNAVGERGSSSPPRYQPIERDQDREQRYAGAQSPSTECPRGGRIRTTQGRTRKQARCSPDPVGGRFLREPRSAPGHRNRVLAALFGDPVPAFADLTNGNGCHSEIPIPKPIVTFRLEARKPCIRRRARSRQGFDQPPCEVTRMRDAAYRAFDACGARRLATSVPSAAAILSSDSSVGLALATSIALTRPAAPLPRRRGRPATTTSQGEAGAGCGQAAASCVSDFGASSARMMHLRAKNATRFRV